MRKGFAIFIIIIFFFLTSGCMNNISAVREDNTFEKETTVNDDSINNKKDTSENTKIDANTDREEVWFSTNTFQSVNNLIGKIIEKQREVVHHDELLKLIKNPLHFDNWELLTNSGKLLRYQFEDIEYFTNEGDKEIDLFNLDEYFSEEIFYSSFSDGAASIVLDYKNNIMAVLKNEYSKKTILSAVKFNENFYIEDLSFIGGYKDDEDYKIALMDNKNEYYMLNTNPIQLISEEKMDNWKFISGYTDVGYINKKEALCGYFINEKENKMRKELLSHDEVIYTINIDERIKGNIIKIKRDMGMLFLLSEENNNYELYLTKEDDFNFLEKRGRDSEGKTFKKIDDIHIYAQNEKSMHLIIFVKNSEIPIKKIEAYGPEWEVPN